MYRHIVTALLLIIALTFYFAGVTEGVVLALLAGAAFELWFWVRLLSPNQRGRSSKAT